jgi:hypothetical protein
MGPLHVCLQLARPFFSRSLLTSFSSLSIGFHLTVKPCFNTATSYELARKDKPKRAPRVASGAVKCPRRRAKKTKKKPRGTPFGCKTPWKDGCKDEQCRPSCWLGSCRRDQCCVPPFPCCLSVARCAFACCLLLPRLCSLSWSQHCLARPVSQSARVRQTRRTRRGIRSSCHTASADGVRETWLQRTCTRTRGD